MIQGHSIVKARQAGLHPNAILYKPFRLDQLIDVAETLVDFHNDIAAHNRYFCYVTVVDLSPLRLWL